MESWYEGETFFSVAAAEAEDDVWLACLLRMSARTCSTVVKASAVLMPQAEPS